MRLRSALLATALMAGASIALPAPARAGVPVCVGTQSTIVLCSDPRGGRLLYCEGNIGQYLC